MIYCAYVGSLARHDVRSVVPEDYITTNIENNGVEEGTIERDVFLCTSHTIAYVLITVCLEM